MLLNAAGYSYAQWHKDESGKPIADIDELAISMTHTAGFAAAALLCAPGETAALGIDAEKLTPHPRADRLANRFFGPAERALCARDATPHTFFTCFTAKEAFAKYCGDGLARHLRGDDTAAPDFEKSHGVRFLRFEQNNVLITLCLPAGCRPQIIEK